MRCNRVASLTRRVSELDQYTDAVNTAVRHNKTSSYNTKHSAQLCTRWQHTNLKLNLIIRLSQLLGGLVACCTSPDQTHDVRMLVRYMSRRKPSSALSLTQTHTISHSHVTSSRFLNFITFNVKMISSFSSASVRIFRANWDVLKMLCWIIPEIISAGETWWTWWEVLIRILLQE